MPNNNELASASRRRLLQLAALGAATALLPACRDEAAPVPGQGDRFPDVALPDLDGRPGSLSAYSNVALIVNFWATWCKPCRLEMPSLEKLATMFRPEDLRVVCINVDSDQNLAREFNASHKLALPLLSDSDQALSNRVLRITGYPTTYLLKRDHTIASIIVGARDWVAPQMIGEIEAQLSVRRVG